MEAEAAARRATEEAVGRRAEAEAGAGRGVEARREASQELQAARREAVAAAASQERLVVRGPTPAQARAMQQALQGTMLADLLASSREALSTWRWFTFSSQAGAAPGAAGQGRRGATPSRGTAPSRVITPSRVTPEMLLKLQQAKLQQASAPPPQEARAHHGSHQGSRGAQASGGAGGAEGERSADGTGALDLARKLAQSRQGRQGRAPAPAPSPALPEKAAPRTPLPSSSAARNAAANAPASAPGKSGFSIGGLLRRGSPR